MYLAPQPLGAVQEGGAAPSDLGLDWMLAAPSVCVTNGCVTELVGTFTLHCRRLRGPLKGRPHTTPCGPCGPGISDRLRRRRGIGKVPKTWFSVDVTYCRFCHATGTTYDLGVQLASCNYSFSHSALLRH